MKMTNVLWICLLNLSNAMIIPNHINGLSLTSKPPPTIPKKTLFVHHNVFASYKKLAPSSEHIDSNFLQCTPNGNQAHSEKENAYKSQTYSERTSKNQVSIKRVYELVTYTIQKTESILLEFTTIRNDNFKLSTNTTEEDEEAMAKFYDFIKAYLEVLTAMSDIINEVLLFDKGRLGVKDKALVVSHDRMVGFQTLFTILDANIYDALVKNMNHFNGRDTLLVSRDLPVVKDVKCAMRNFMGILFRVQSIE